MKIHRLKETVINRIAAGEVVERPAAAVKELLENAIDAAADRIDIAIAAGGKTLIRVCDNGCGIAADELELAIARHCTSKMGDDIHDIRALGFRGEALPSIASVARLRLASRINDAPHGAEIYVNGGIAGAVKPAAIACGSIVEVRDLFYATPARLKFLKSDRAETAAIGDIVKRTSIAFPHIRFTLNNDGRIISDLPAAAPPMKDASGSEAGIQAYRPRLTQILGKDFMDNSVELHAVREGVSLFGFISVPSYNRGNALHQFFYVNNRPVRDKNLMSALRAAYADMLPFGRSPAAALFLKLEPDLVDVNVHPAKADVRFRDAGLIRGLIIGAIRQALEQAGARTATTASQAFMRIAAANAVAPAAGVTTTATTGGALHRQTGAYTQQTPHNQKDFCAQAQIIGTTKTAKPRTLNSFHEDAAVFYASEAEFLQAQSSRMPPSDSIFSPSADFRPQQDISAENTAAVQSAENENASDTEFPLGAARAQIHQNYIIAQTADSLIIVDQHAAHERLVYEQLKQALYAKPLPTQILLIPEIVELPPEDIAALESHTETLQKFGLFFEPFGIHALAVRETPALLGNIDAQKLMRDLADEIAEYETASGLKNILDYIAATMACHGSVRSGRLLKPQEMNALLRQMEQVPQAGTCNHGRPTFIELKLTDIEKLFARR